MPRAILGATQRADNQSNKLNYVTSLITVSIIEDPVRFPPSLEKRPYSQRGSRNILLTRLPLETCRNMAEVTPASIDALRSRLTTATMFTPDSPGYQESLIRWSDTGRKQAVRHTTCWDMCNALTTAREW